MTTSIPARFDTVIVDGATAFVYQYRGETQQYQINFDRFEEGIKHMQTLLRFEQQVIFQKINLNQKKEY